jgi:CheY-like chemotaxis protein
MDGMETARAIRSLGTKYAGTVPLIAISANALLGDKGVFLSRGFQDFISKPIDIFQLEAVVRRWVITSDSASENMADCQKPEAAESVKSVKVNGFFNLQIDGIDMQRIPKHCGRNEALFGEFLHSFVNNIPELLNTFKLIKTAENEAENLKNYAIHVHGIKGSCRNICADEPAEQADKLEKAANSGDYDYIAANNPDFVESVEKLITNIKNAIN